ncbi:F-box protein SKIP23 [Lathyrus oleraceus]|uniref:F-box domain-containing protein n=1 Tax=Pisum sativum TaxID=3888 RepID=A0A9D5ALS7_PEA|nr:F-box protein SKIP23 [Pisum sativum]KAI5410435.1 hypothetical protein KIW84_055805 [Pisum sativum]
MADWSQLPKDLLHLISQKLNSQFYQLRFRSVCSSWRSSTPQNHHNHHHHLNLPPKFPNPSNNDSTNDDSTFPLSKRTLFLISPPPNQQTLHPWLIKIGPDSRDQSHLWHPLSRDKHFPLHFPNLIDFNQLPVIDLGCEFVIGNFPSQSSSLPLNNSLYMEKVVVFDADADTWQIGNGKAKAKANRCSVLLTIHISGKLAVFRCGDERCDERWTIIPEMLTPYDDVCVFNGRPVAVDSTGRAVVVGADLSVELVAEPVFGGDKKFLVESDGELLLVDKYLSCLVSCLRDDGDGEGDGGGVYEIEHGFAECEFCEIGRERAVRFHVFRLDQKEKKWVEVKSLEDRVLFLGEDCAFSASAFDLRIGYGNCVIFRDDVYSDSQSSELGVGVFHLGQFRIAPLSCFPCYSMFFWPPPEWVGLH